MVAFIPKLLGNVGFSKTRSKQIQGVKSLAFLDVAGDWGPNLAYVMDVALLVTTIIFCLILKRDKPIFDHHFKLLTKQELDPHLFGGAALFGMGWRMTGYCPGSAIASIGMCLQYPTMLLPFSPVSMHTNLYLAIDIIRVVPLKTHAISL